MKRVVSTVLFCVVVYALSLIALALIAPLTTAVGPGSEAFTNLGTPHQAVTRMTLVAVISAPAPCRTHVCAVPAMSSNPSATLPMTTSPNFTGVGLWLVPFPADLILASWFVRRMLRTGRMWRVAPS
jgi:hypothetical protein